MRIIHFRELAAFSIIALVGCESNLNVETLESSPKKGDAATSEDAPQMTISGPTSLTSMHPIPLVAKFSSEISGLTPSEFEVTGGEIQNLSGSGANYTFSVEPSQSVGEISVKFAPTTCQSRGKVACKSLSTALTFKYDYESPTATFYSLQGGLTSTTPISVQIKLSKEVPKLSPSDLVVSNATIASLSGSGLDYVVDLMPTGSGEVGLNLKSSSIVDSAGNTMEEVSGFATKFAQPYEVMVLLDRSGSMLYDTTGTDFSFAPGNPLLSSYTLWGTLWRNQLSPPHPTASRWAMLTNNLGQFFNEAALGSVPPRFGLVTFSTNYTRPIAPFTVYPATQNEMSIPAPAGFDFAASRVTFESKVAAWSSGGFMGDSNGANALQVALPQLQTANHSANAKTAVVLLTDGQWTVGTTQDVINASHSLAAAGVTVHVLQLISSGGEDANVRQVATITGGDFYYATNASQVQAALTAVARKLAYRP